MSASVVRFLILFCIIADGAFALRHISSGIIHKSQLERMTVHKVTSSLYVAGKNFMAYNEYPRTEAGFVGDRTLFLTVNRSQVEDCPGTYSCVDDAYSKGLAIDYENDRLITCWNFPQGHCEKRNLTHIRETDEEVNLPLVPLDKSSSSYILVTDGPTGDQALYVAASRSTEGTAEVKDQIPPISIRDPSTFSFLLVKGQAALLRFQEDVQGMFNVEYIYGFAHNGFVYFVTNQVTKFGTYSPKLVRVCQKEQHLINSYAELTLECRSEKHKYNMATSAFYHEGKEQSGSSCNSGSSLLVAAADGTWLSTSSRMVYNGQVMLDGTVQVGQSAGGVCQYKMEDVEQAFKDNIQACFRGEGHTGPAHVTRPQQCQQTDITIPVDYCGSHGYNMPVEGATPLVQKAPLESHDQTYTAVAAMETKGHLVTFVGTSLGRVFMYDDSNRTEPCGTYQFDKVEGSNQEQPIKQIDIGHGLIKEQIFVLTSNTIARLATDADKLCTFPHVPGQPSCGPTSSSPQLISLLSLHSLAILLSLLCAQAFFIF